MSRWTFPFEVFPDLDLDALEVGGTLQWSGGLDLLTTASTAWMDFVGLEQRWDSYVVGDFIVAQNA